MYLQHQHPNGLCRRCLHDGFDLFRGNQQIINRCKNVTDVFVLILLLYELPVIYYCSNLRRRVMADLSRPLVGSSRKSIRGRVRISSPILTRRLSPPLRPRRCQLPMGVSAQSWRPISTMVLSTMAFTADRDRVPESRMFAEKFTVSRTVSVPIRSSDCVT